MRYMPIFVDLEAKPVLIVGAGIVALRRARQLLDAGARVTVIAPSAVAEFRELAGVELVERPVQIEDVSSDYRLVIAATDNADVNAMISDECADLGILCNRCDDLVKAVLSVATHCDTARLPAQPWPAVCLRLQSTLTGRSTP